MMKKTIALSLFLAPLMGITSQSHASQCEKETTYLNEILNFEINEDLMEVKTEQLRSFAERAKAEKHNLSNVIATYNCSLKANLFLEPVENFEVYITQGHEPVVREIYLIQKPNQLKHRGNFYIELSGSFDGKKTQLHTKLQFIQQAYFYPTGESPLSAYNEDLLTNQTIAYSSAPQNEIQLDLQADFRNLRMHNPTITSKKLITQVGIQNRLELGIFCQKK